MTLQAAQALPTTGGEQPLDLTACDREPIHVPGAIQPDGLLLIADEGLHVIGGAGEIEARLAADWLGRPLAELLGQDVSDIAGRVSPGTVARLDAVRGATEAFQAFATAADGRLLIVLEPAAGDVLSAADLLGTLDTSATAFERSGDLTQLCERAAVAFREITGFDRVMIYRFLDDGAGMVIAEDRDPALGTFLNHHFPASDIPKQARALYVRNRVRSIADVNYRPAPVRPAAEDGIDLSDVSIRSVSPIHLQYLRNMGVGASASVSIVRDGLLWGLVACHHNSPRGLSYEVRAACSALASGLARQVRAKEESETYRERIRLRAAEDAIVARIDGAESPTNFFEQQAGALRTMLSADGFAMISPDGIVSDGVCPPASELAALGRWLSTRAGAEPFVSRSLIERYPAAQDFAEQASGALAVTLPGEGSVLLAWFRVEVRELVEWAGNPHKGSDADPTAILTPRTSFESWSEEVRYRALPWSLAQVEAAARLRRQLVEQRQTRRLRELNRELSATIADKEALIVQKDHLLREVNHRVQNSLQLVQAFLSLQERQGETNTIDTLREAQRRISAVALVHRRLYQAEELETIDLSRYLEELLADMRGAMGGEWAQGLSLDLAPMLISADRAVNVGLILTELVINANKYAYGGGSGPISVLLEPYRNQFRLIVADQGKGKSGTREGFGTRMMKAMVQRLDGTIETFDNAPGMRVIVSAPAGTD